MAPNRLQLVEEQLKNIKSVLEQERTEHARDRDIMKVMGERLKESERKRKLAEQDAQHMALVEKYRAEHDEIDARNELHYTDDKTLLERLPNVPSRILRYPKGHRRRAIAREDTDLDGGVALLLEECKPSVDDRIGQTRATKRTYSETEYVDLVWSFLPLLTCQQSRSQSQSACRHCDFS